MHALIQRVSEASVSVAGTQIAAIEVGMLALIGVEQNDGRPEVERMAERLLKFRLFPDADGRMNEDIRSLNGGLLLVPQFTLAADTDSGHRPSFSRAAPPQQAHRLFEDLIRTIEDLGQTVKSGRFGADMQVALVNDGPVTFSLRVEPSHS